jgi:hypothetical protein
MRYDCVIPTIGRVTVSKRFLLTEAVIKPSPSHTGQGNNWTARKAPQIGDVHTQCEHVTLLSHAQVPRLMTSELSIINMQARKDVRSASEKDINAGYSTRSLIIFSLSTTSLPIRAYTTILLLRLMTHPRLLFNVNRWRQP